MPRLKRPADDCLLQSGAERVTLYSATEGRSGFVFFWHRPAKICTIHIAHEPRLFCYPLALGSSETTKQARYVLTLKGGVMKSGFTLYDAHDNKLEMTLDGIETVTIEIGDPTDWEHGQSISVPFDDFLDFIRTVAREFDIQGE